MASIIYLDIDDEITSAAARIRVAEAVRIALVLPAGSHLATSRINFRLLAREAQGRSRQLIIVAPDAAARALAASAGLPVYASVRELEAETSPPEDPSGASVAVAPGAAQAAGRGPGGPRVAPGATPAAAGPSVAAAGAATGVAGAAPALSGTSPTDDTVIVRTPRPSGRQAQQGAAATGALIDDARAGGHAPADLPVTGRSGRRRRTAIAVILAALAMLVFVGGVLGYVFLPAATIVVTPRIEPIGPLTFPVRADPAVTAPDTVGGVVPATVATH
jgi:hypothetical protein